MVEPRRAAALRALAWATAVVAAGLFIAAAANRPIGHRFFDLDIYIRSVAAIVRGDSLYVTTAANPNPVTYPPFGVAVLLPLHWIRVGVAQVLWTAMTVVATAWACRVVARHVVWPADERLRWPLLCACASVSAPFASNIRFGQLSVVMFALVVVAVFADVGDRAGGAALGAAIAAKLTPAVFVALLAVEGRWRRVGWALATFAGSSVATAAALASDSKEFWLHGLFGTSKYGNTWNHGNQSFLAMLHRAGLGDAPASVVWALVAAVVAAAGVAGARALVRADQRFTAVVVIGCLGLIVSPVSWAHHQWWLLLAAFIPLPGVRARTQLVWWAVLMAIVTIPVPLGGWGDGVLSGPHYVADNLRGIVALCLVLVLPAVIVRTVARGPVPAGTGRAGEPRELGASFGADAPA